MSAAKTFNAKSTGFKYTGPFRYAEAQDKLNALPTIERREASLVFVGRDFFISHGYK